MMANFTRTLLSTVFTASVVLGSSAALAASSAPVTPPQVVSAPVVDKVDQLTLLVAQAMPIADIMTMVKAEMPSWPFQDNPNAVSAEQLGCVRQEMNTENYIAQTKVDVQSYISSHPDKVDGDIQLLTSASKLWGSALKLGYATPKATSEDTKRLLSESKPEELLALMNLIQGPSNEDLRELIGIDGLKLGSKRTNGNQAGNAKQVGKDAALAKMTPLLLKSMATCNVSMKSLL